MMMFIPFPKSTVIIYVRTTFLCIIVECVVYAAAATALFFLPKMLIRFFCFSATTGCFGATGIGPCLTTAAGGEVGRASAFITDVRRPDEIFGSEVLRLMVVLEGMVYRF